MPRQFKHQKLSLWQFLLELLTDKHKANMVRWIDENGNFKMLLPEEIAKAWGEATNNEQMTYGKIARALRYYYNTGIIEKSEQRFCYKFTMNLKEIIGYSSKQLYETMKKQYQIFDQHHSIKRRLCQVQNASKDLTQQNMSIQTINEQAKHAKHFKPRGENECDTQIVSSVRMPAPHKQETNSFG